MGKLKASWLAAAFSLGASAAGGVTLDGSNSTLSVTLQDLPPLVVTGGSSSAVTVSGSGGFVEPGGLFQGTVAVPGQLLTGVPQISGLALQVTNPTLAVTPTGGPGGGMGGFAGLQGQVFVNVLNLLNLTIPLSVVGAGGSISGTLTGTLTFQVTGTGWTTGTAMITGVVTPDPNYTGTGIPPNVNTITFSGFDNRTPVHGAGTISLISAFKVSTKATTPLASVARQTLVFIPEPGILLLLGSGVAALALRGLRRSRK